MSFAIPKRIPSKVFAKKVLSFVLNELSFWDEQLKQGDEQSDERAFCEANESETPFYQCIGKSSSLFALMNQEKVKLTLLQRRRRFPNSPKLLDKFLQVFSTSYLGRIESLPAKWLPVIILMYCGVVGAIAYCCRERSDLVDACYLSLEMDMLTFTEDIERSIGWEEFYDTSKAFAISYDRRFWKNDSDEEEEIAETARTPLDIARAKEKTIGAIRAEAETPEATTTTAAEES